MWDVDDKSGSAGARTNSSVSAPSRKPLDIPPALRGDVEVPKPNQIVKSSASVSTVAKESAVKEPVAGKGAGLDARVYDADAAHLFSTVVDAMTALNLPVQSVDSPSGTVTTDWIRRKKNPSALAGFGFGGAAVLAIRWRFVVRVLRQQVDEEVQTRLEIRTVGQEFKNRHWVDRQTNRKVSDELFSAIEERL